MKLTALFSAAALAAGTLMTAAPAEAQRYGYDRGYDHRGYDRRDDRGWRGGPRYHGRGFDRGRGYGYGGGYGGGYGRGYGRGRVVCRVHRGYSGPERRCFTVYR